VFIVDEGGERKKRSSADYADFADFFETKRINPP
jgi:hypothetical protein